jgi:hypothetical protein
MLRRREHVDQYTGGTALVHHRDLLVVTHLYSAVLNDIACNVDDHNGPHDCGRHQQSRLGVGLHPWAR